MLLVQPFCSYLSNTNVRWRDGDFAAHYYTLMCKGDEEKLAALKTTARTLPLGHNGAPERVVKDAQGRLRVRQHFGRWAARKIRDWGYDAPTIIPVPNSNATPNVNQFPTFQIASAISTAFGQTAAANGAIRFRQAMAKSHLGGTRNEEELVANMVTRPDYWAAQVILVDDVITSGSHLKAARRALQGAGMEVQHVVVCARRMDEQVANPFALDAEDLDLQAEFDFFDGL